jgi:hypothetical protein
MTTIERLLDVSFVVGTDGKVDISLCNTDNLSDVEKELVEMTKIILVRFGSLRTMIEDIARTYKATLTADGMNSLIADEKIKDIVHRKILCKLDTILIPS